MDSRLSTSLVILCLSVLASADKIPVTIYFESLCPDSQRFVVSQFTPAYQTKDLSKFITPDFVPYGHANATDCQHGPLECEGNKILGCAIHKINKTEDLVNFVNCIMGLKVDKNISSNATFPVEKCMKEAGSDYDEIIKCHSSEEGKMYNEEYGKRTNATFSGTFGVPFIIVNNATNEDTSKQLASNFLETMCGILKNKTIEACGKNSASTLVASLIPAVLALIIARL